jgi:glycosyltransferase involved in cell wall biosynthesis
MTQAECDVSVVVPCYRSTDVVGRAVESVARQSALPRQIILVDDGSPDATADALYDIQRRYGAEWATVVLLPDNAGPAAARNAGWERAAGTWIAFLDADDAWHRDKLMIQHARMRERPDIVLTGHLSRHADTVDCLVESVDELPQWSRLRRKSLLFRNRFSTASVAMIRRDVGLRFDPSFRFSQDYNLWLQVICLGHEVEFCHCTLSFYFKDLFGHSGQTRNLVNALNAERRIYKLLCQEEHINSYERMLFTNWARIKHFRRYLITTQRKFTKCTRTQMN